MTPCASCGQPQCGYIIDAEFVVSHAAPPPAPAREPAAIAMQPPLTRRELVTEALRNTMRVRGNWLSVGLYMFAVCCITMGIGYLWVNVATMVVATASLALSLQREYRLSRVVGQIRHQI